MVFPVMDLSPRPAIVEQVKQPSQNEIIASTEKLIIQYKRERDQIMLDINKMQASEKDKPKTVQDFERFRELMESVAVLNVQILQLEGSLVFLKMGVSKKQN